MDPSIPTQQWPRPISYQIPQEQTHLPTHNPPCARETYFHNQYNFTPPLYVSATPCNHSVPSAPHCHHIRTSSSTGEQLFCLKPPGGWHWTQRDSLWSPHFESIRRCVKGIHVFWEGLLTETVHPSVLFFCPRELSSSEAVTTGRAVFALWGYWSGTLGPSV